MHGNNIIPSKIDRFEGIYFRTRKSLFHYIRKFAPVEENMVEDILQECYLRLWENLEAIGQTSEDPIPLLRTYAINLCINHLKKTAREKLREKVYTDQQPAEMQVYDETAYTSRIKIYRQVVDAMPQQRKLVYQLVKEEKLSYKEISEQLGISTKTIERHINEAMRTLRSKISVVLGRLE